ncbi:hypothetical protein FB45DRAFT_1065221 [Roridomyces roridus]|uniref:Uncharacterized protein n=1 Tax=Roridomyces roridus TaxID=1738132 RepID=A0AAD7B8M4_9AGAR|nr:hypothetical protein FB45DRAFT_1065221 [Roridomyces roridus]
MEHGISSTATIAESATMPESATTTASVTLKSGDAGASGASLEGPGTDGRDGTVAQLELATLTITRKATATGGGGGAGGQGKTKGGMGGAGAKAGVMHPLLSEEQIQWLDKHNQKLSTFLAQHQDTMGEVQTKLAAKGYHQLAILARASRTTLMDECKLYSGNVEELKMLMGEYITEGMATPPSHPGPGA